MLKSFFNPKSLAIVGASRDETKLGFKILKNVIEGKYKGKVYPINPKTTEILNLKCYPNISSIPEVPELVLIVIPATFVCDVLEESGRKGVKNVIVISAGFKEGGEEGKKREEKLIEIIKKYGIRVIGPNCLGIISTINNLNASFAVEMPPKGKITFISQSGALGTAILDWACKEEVGLSNFISLGNKADVSEVELIEFFADDVETNVILLYLEGIKDGRKFMEVAKKVVMKKPIIVVKSGITPSGLKAVSSHTGSLAGSEKAFEVAFLQSGVLRAFSVQELFDYALLFSYQPLIDGENIAIVTNAGGPSVMAVDAIEKIGLKLAQLSSETKEKLKSFLPESANINNPVDALGDVSAEKYGQTLEVVIKDSSVNGIIAILTPQAVTQPFQVAENVVNISSKYKKPVVCCFMGGKQIEKGINFLSKNLIPNYSFPERAVSAFSGMVFYKNYLKKRKGEIIKFNVDKEKVKKIFEDFKRKKRFVIGDIESREILSSYGVNTICSFLAKDFQQCKKYIKNIGFPLVMKLVSPDIIHKTDAGGVKIGIKNLKMAEKSFYEIIDSAKKYKKDAKIYGIQIQKQIEKAVEVIIGVNNDPQFGHILMFGLGGVYVEILKDVSFRIIPITDVDVEEMIYEIKGYKILKGFRNIPECDIESIKEVLLRVSQLCIDFPEIKEMDINPLMVYEKGKGVVSVDVRIALEKGER